MDKTYVYQGNEVVLTGRCATKQSHRGVAKTLYEIKLAKYRESDDIATDWVDFSDLYHVEINPPKMEE